MSDDRTFMDKVLGRDDEPRGDTRERTAEEFPTPRDHRERLAGDEARRDVPRESGGHSPDDGWLEPTPDGSPDDGARRGPAPTAADVDPATRPQATAAPEDRAAPEHHAASDRRATPDHGAGVAGDRGGSYADRLGDRDPHAGEEPVALVPTDRAQDYRHRWEGLKASFVDEPRGAVRDANELVGHVLDDVAELFATQRADLEKDLRDEQADTEALRQALNRYRAFFDRLLTL
jgi:hypothetical protein